MTRRTGSLVVAGTGILSGGHLTDDAREAIVRADRVFYVISNPLMERMVVRLNPAAESLQGLYAPGKPREKTYAQMVRALLAPVRRGAAVCAAFYGHPGVFVTPGHEAVRQARSEGYAAEMLPGISAEDCLFADLGVDPARNGCASFEATDFLIWRRTWDPHSALVLWQISVIGELGYPQAHGRRNLRVLAERLRAAYPASHEVVVYEASSFPGLPADVHRCALSQLARAPLTHFATLYVPPLEGGAPDRAMLRKLGISR